MKCIACHSVIDDEAVFCPACDSPQPGAVEPTDYEYAAFISYRHRSPDSEVAARLHRAIETYRLPARVAQTYGSRTTGTVFRDEEELSAATHLPDAIRKAIRASRALVVVCSPTTRDSAWIAREIELFASYHGRSRIYAVIAEGSSAESIPPQLRKLAVPDSAAAVVGTEAEPLAADLRESARGRRRAVPASAAAVVGTEAEPLAADLRESARGRRRAETLKLIAALVGCPYDELARRNRGRAVKRAAVAGMAAICVLAGIAVFALQAAHDRESALLAESEQLAAQSREELAHGDRYQAIESALAALPQSSADTSRPISERAVDALREALGVGAEDGRASPWNIGYSVEAETGVSVIGETSMIHAVDAVPESIGAVDVSEGGAYFAVLDDAFGITSYDLSTGKELARMAVPGVADNQPTHATAECADGSIFTGAAGEDGALACFDARTGEPIWQRPDLPAATMSLSYDQSVLDVAALERNGRLFVASLDARTGETLASSTIPLAAGTALSRGIKSTVGDVKAEMFVALDGRLVKAGTDGGALAQTTLAYGEIASLAYLDKTLVTASVESYDEENLELAYCIEAFDGNLERLWEHHGTIASEMLVNGDYTALVLGWPAVCGLAPDGGKTVVATAGRSVVALSAETGDTLFAQDFASTVLTAYPLLLNGNPSVLTLCCDGAVSLRNLEGNLGNTAGDEYHFNFGEDLRWGSFAIDGNRLTAIGASALSDKRFVVRWTETDGSDGSGDSSLPDRDYSLDELIAIAHEELAGH